MSVRETFVAVEEQQEFHTSEFVCVCVWACARAFSLSYPANSAHAPYYIVISALCGSTTVFGIIS
jgi:hypothetical protein